MTRTLLRALLAVALGSAATECAAQPSLDQLYREARWFELRDAIEGRDAPPLYRAVVASAFNRPDEAERALEPLVRDSSDETAGAAVDALLSLYARAGRFGDVLELADDALARFPERADLRNVVALFGPAHTRNQRLVRSRRASFGCTVSAEGVHLPITVNGHPVRWLLDTGANVTVTSEAEALALGIALQKGGAETIDGAGGTATARAAVARLVTVGGTELRDVAMIVFPDGQPPWDELEPGTRGILGLPLALALETIRWTSAGTCEVGPGSRVTGPTGGGARASEADLAFHEATPSVRVWYEGRPLTFMLDTGNVGETQLWARFAADFPALVEQGTKSHVRLTQLGGSSEHEVTVLSEVALRIGDFDTTLKPANVFAAPVGNGVSHGNLGMDLLSRASEITLDFRSMVMVIR
jgi:hypothetical protein